MNEIRIFQFETLSFDTNTNHYGGIEKILYGTEFYNQTVSYLDAIGNTIYMSEKYADLILRGARESKVSSYHIASRIKQEVGPFLSHHSISGTVLGFEGYYNFYNIGATSSAEPMGAIKNGLQYAKDGKGASQETKNEYLIPWNTKEKSITGGATFIGSSYIHLGQNTVYLQKFDVNDEKPGNLFWHQYMTNVLAPYSESKSIYTGYKNSGLLDNSMRFIIPVFENMPETMTQSPNINPNDYETDQTRVYANVSGSLNVRSGPNTSYEVITTIQKDEEITRIAKGRQNGELWDKVKLDNGIIGYVFQNYLAEVPEMQVEQIELSLNKSVIEKNEKTQLNVKISPEEVKNVKIIYSSENPNVAIVNGEGEITGIKSGKANIIAKVENSLVSANIEIEVYTSVQDIQVNTESRNLSIGSYFQINAWIVPEDANNKTIIYESSDEQIVKVSKGGLVNAVGEGESIIRVTTQENQIQKVIPIKVRRRLSDDELQFHPTLKVNADQITGIDPDRNTVAQIKEDIITDYKVEIYDYKNELLEENQQIGTGSKIKIKENDDVIAEYYIILYGDINGDGKINSIDLLVLQRQILGLSELEANFLKAGNISKNGKMPTSVDLLLIQRHILNLKLIEQQ